MALYFYSILFIISIILTLIYAVMWHKHFSVHYTLIFVIIPVSIVGYIMSAEADSLGAAIMATKFIYIGGCFLQIFLLLSIFRLCNIDLSKRLTVILISFTMIVYMSVLTIGHFPLFYKNITFKQVNDSYVLIKEYGFMHDVFLIMLFLFFFLNLSAVIYSYLNKMDVSNRVIIVLFVLDSMSLLSYVLGRNLIEGIELTPVSYVIAQVLFLVIIHWICMYDVTDSAIDSIVQTGDTGIISLDFKYKYLGCNQTAKDILPELYKIRVDTSIKTQKELGDLLIPWIETFRNDESDDKFYMKRGSKTYLADINYLYNGEKKRGYQFLLTDDTKNQEYIALINNYNADLQKEVNAKTAHIREMSDRLILDMAIMVESRDNSTGGHIRRTADCVRILIDEILKDNKFNLSDEFCRNVIKAAPMHDLGKIAVDDAVLRKPGRFTPEEYEKMKVHAPEGARIVHEILKDTDDAYFHQIAENIAHYHHERWDGSGYPKGLKGDDIPLEARIMAIADVYDALVSKRVYKEKMSFEKADSIIMEGMGKHFDERLKPYYISARPRLEEYYNNQE